MKLFIDCEWNEFGGELISMALCALDGSEFYEVLPCEHPGEWVSKNVMPVLQKQPVSITEFRNKLKNFLGKYESVEIIADWPEDVSRFCDALIVGPGMKIPTPDMKFIITDDYGESELPHNALYDARGNMQAYLNSVYTAA